MLLLLPHGHGLLMMIAMNNKNIYLRILQFITRVKKVISFTQKKKKLFLSPTLWSGRKFFFFFFYHSFHGVDVSQSYEDMNLRTCEKHVSLNGQIR